MGRENTHFYMDSILKDLFQVTHFDVKSVTVLLFFRDRIRILELCHSGYPVKLSRELYQESSSISIAYTLS